MFEILGYLMYTHFSPAGLILSSVNQLCRSSSYLKILILFKKNINNFFDWKKCLIYNQEPKETLQYTFLLHFDCCSSATCVQMCCFKLLLWENPFPHFLHTNGFSPVWDRTCKSYADLYRSNFPQYPHCKKLISVAFPEKLCWCWLVPMLISFCAVGLSKLRALLLSKISEMQIKGNVSTGQPTWPVVLTFSFEQWAALSKKKYADSDHPGHA